MQHIAARAPAALRDAMLGGDSQRIVVVVDDDDDVNRCYIERNRFMMKLSL